MRKQGIITILLILTLHRAVGTGTIPNATIENYTDLVIDGDWDITGISFYSYYNITVTGNVNISYWTTVPGDMRFKNSIINIGEDLNINGSSIVFTNCELDVGGDISIFPSSLHQSLVEISDSTVIVGNDILNSGYLNLENDTVSIMNRVDNSYHISFKESTVSIGNGFYLREGSDTYVGGTLTQSNQTQEEFIISEHDSEFVIFGNMTVYHDLEFHKLFVGAANITKIGPDPLLINTLEGLVMFHTRDPKFSLYLINGEVYILNVTGNFDIRADNVKLKLIKDSSLTGNIEINNADSVDNSYFVVGSALMNTIQNNNLTSVKIINLDDTKIFNNTGNLEIDGFNNLYLQNNSFSNVNIGNGDSIEIEDSSFENLSLDTSSNINFTRNSADLLNLVNIDKGNFSGNELGAMSTDNNTNSIYSENSYESIPELYTLTLPLDKPAGSSISLNTPISYAWDGGNIVLGTTIIELPDTSGEHILWYSIELDGNYFSHSITVLIGDKLPESTPTDTESTRATPVSTNEETYFPMIGIVAIPIAVKFKRVTY